MRFSWSGVHSHGNLHGKVSGEKLVWKEKRSPLTRVSPDQDRILFVWALIRIVYHQVEPSLGWSIIRVGPHQGGLSSGWALIRVVSHQGEPSSGWSFIRVSLRQGGLSLGWALIRVVFHQGELLLGGSLIYYVNVSTPCLVVAAL